MGRPRSRPGARGGEDVQAIRTTGPRLATGIASVACLLATLALPMTRGGDVFREFGVRVGAFAFLALVAGIVLGWMPLVPVSAALAGGLYGVELAISDAPLDTAAPGIAAALLLCTELAYWSGEERTRWRGDAGDGLRRAAVVALLGAGAFFVAASMLALVDAVRTRGLAVDLLGAIAAVTVLATVLVVARGQRRQES